MAGKSLCKIEGCGKPRWARGWCVAHYTRWRNHGDPLRLIGTSKGLPQKFFSEVVLPYSGDACLIWPYQRNKGGYRVMRDVRSRKDRSVHRMACEQVNGPAPSSRHDAAHRCGNGHKGCCAPLHTKWATPSENMMDRVDHGTDSRGEKSWNAKLTEEDVRAIRALHGQMSLAKIGAKFGVHRGTIEAVTSRRSWAWLK